ncbi:MAG: DUF268 domain-containing protein [Gammaproteobacteria bacterium]|nr:DUF268 domain-containing protein [Gammaproteobacteria bacterium]
MRSYLNSVYSILLTFGLDPLKFLRALKGLPVYSVNFLRFIQQRKNCNSIFGSLKIFPCLDDRYSESGGASGHYFHQDLLVARKIYENKPKLHVDVGSRIDGFVAHVAAFREIVVMDIRKMNTTIPNISFIQCNIMADLPESLIGSYDSLSCLHALEHFGLGRYGDPVKYDGHVIGFNNLHKMLRPAGKMYLSIPIGPQRVEYDAHRVFSIRYILDLVSLKFTLNSFSYVDDAGDLFQDVPLLEKDIGVNFGCMYGCGIFEMSKL